MENELFNKIFYTKNILHILNTQQSYAVKCNKKKIS